MSQPTNLAATTCGGHASLALAQSPQSIVSGPSVMNPRPTREPQQSLQIKHSLCQLLSSNVTNLVPPRPVMACEQA